MAGQVCIMEQWENEDHQKKNRIFWREIMQNALRVESIYKAAQTQEFQA